MKVICSLLLATIIAPLIDSVSNSSYAEAAGGSTNYIGLSHEQQLARASRHSQDIRNLFALQLAPPPPPNDAVQQNAAGNANEFDVNDSDVDDEIVEDEVSSFVV